MNGWRLHPVDSFWVWEGLASPGPCQKAGVWARRIDPAKSEKSGMCSEKDFGSIKANPQSMSNPKSAQTRGFGGKTLVQTKRQ